MIEKNFERKIFFGGSIITINDKQPIVEAVGVIGEKINSVGSLEYVKSRMENDYTLVNLNGSTLLPGFIDSHLHPIIFAFYLLNPDLTNVNSLEDLKQILKNASETKGEDELLIGFNLN